MSSGKLCTWLVVGLFVSLMVAEAAKHPSTPSVTAAATTGMIPFNVRAWLQLLRTKISKIKTAVEGSKRSCNGFPCMYTHLGAKAGRQAMMRSLMSIIHNCAHDPNCSPGKRRRRSVVTSKVLSMLTHKRTMS